MNKTITVSRLSIITHNDRLVISRYQDYNILPLELKPSSYLHFRQLAFVHSGKVIVEQCRYKYSLSDNPDNEQDWVFRYDYCLYPKKDVPHAHMHFNGTFREGSMRHIHFPTGRISVEQIIAHLITEYGVRSKIADWLEVLAESHRGFIERRTDLKSSLFP